VKPHLDILGRRNHKKRNQIFSRSFAKRRLIFHRKEDSTMKKITTITMLACLCFVCATNFAYSAVDVLLKVTGIDGESVIKGHEGEIDILSWSWQISNPNDALSTYGGGAYPPVINPLIMTKYIDEASPYFAIILLNNSIIDEAILTVRKAGKDAVDYLKVKMWAVRVVDLTNGGSGGEDRLVETVAFVFSRVCYEYTPQKDDGTANASIEKCWDIALNVPY
jgi:type VI secretion system secreted protein Hcp